MNSDILNDSLAKRELYSTPVLSGLLQQLQADNTEQRQDVVEWLGYCLRSGSSRDRDRVEKDIVRCWKREVLNAEAARLPAVLFVGGDLIQMTSLRAPAVAAGLAKLFIPLLETLLHRASSSEASALHRCIWDLAELLSTNALLPKAWSSSLTALRNKIGNDLVIGKLSDGYKWIVEGLQCLDDLWSDAVSLHSKADAAKQKLTVMHDKLKHRHIAGTEEELKMMDQLAEMYLSNTSAFDAKLTGIQDFLKTTIVDHVQQRIPELEKRAAELETLKAQAQAAADAVPKGKRTLDDDAAGEQPSAKQQKKAEPESAAEAPDEVRAKSEADSGGMFSDSDDESDDGVKFHLTKG
ncbi:hypothetical protein DIPPA_19060 [Diplonema papillatum]|nr:hypothetical protein DIPPA_19060 [Diplonema papillatum]